MDEAELREREEIVEDIHERFEEIAVWRLGHESAIDEVRDIYLASLPQAVLWRFIVEN